MNADFDQVDFERIRSKLFSVLEIDEETTTITFHWTPLSQHTVWAHLYRVVREERQAGYAAGLAVGAMLHRDMLR